MAYDRPVQLFQPLDPPRAFEVMARGGQTQTAPSHTRPALQLCIDDGLEWVTLEVRRTKDSRHVLFDCDDLAGRTNGAGRVDEHTLAELQSLDAGSWFGPRSKGAKLLSLAEGLSMAKDRINLCLVCQQVDADRLAEEILTAGLQRQVLLSGDRGTLVKLAARAKANSHCRPAGRRAMVRLARQRGSISCDPPPCRSICGI